MIFIKRSLFLAMAAVAVLPAVASASVTSSFAISDSASASLEGTSTGSSKVVKTVAEGNYRVTDIAESNDHPDKMKVALQADKADGEAFYLYITRNQFDKANLNKGQVVTAVKRPYGVSFKHVDAVEPFVVVLDETWIKDLRSNDIAHS